MKRTISYIAIFMLALGHLMAQPDEYSPKASFAIGQGYYNSESYKEAFRAFNILVDNDMENPHYNYKAGLCLIKIKGCNPEAIEFLEYAVSGVSSDYKSNDYKNRFAPAEAYFYLAYAYHLNYKFDKALEMLKKFKGQASSDKALREQANLLMAQCQNGLKLMKTPVDAIETKLSKSVNSIHDNYFPLISLDENLFVFTSRKTGSSNNKQNKHGKYLSDIYLCEGIEGAFKEPINAGTALNTNQDDAAVGISADGKTMIIERNGDLFFSYLRNGKWTSPENAGENINSSAKEAYASISADGNSLYFSSNRNGGLGGMDIYIATKTADGKWGKPVNAGNAINTKADETTPFISANGKKLYFSSNGKKSIGGFDILCSEKNDMQWSEAQNIGYPINTVRDELGYVQTADGKQAFFAATKGLDEQENIYQLSFPDKKAKKIAIVKGNLRSGNKAELKNAKFSVFETKSQKELYCGNINDNYFVTVLETGKNYVLVCTAENHFSKTIAVELDDVNDFQEVELKLVLQPIIENETAMIFHLADRNSRHKNQEAIKLSQLAQDVKNNPNLVLSLIVDSTLAGTNDKIEEIKKQIAVNHINYQQGTGNIVLKAESESTRTISEKKYAIKFKRNKTNLDTESIKNLDSIATKVQNTKLMQAVIPIVEGNETSENYAQTISYELRNKGLNPQQIRYENVTKLPEKLTVSLSVLPRQFENTLKIFGTKSIKIKDFSFENEEIFLLSENQELQSLAEYLVLNPSDKLKIKIFVAPENKAKEYSEMQRKRGRYVKNYLVSKGVKNYKINLSEEVAEEMPKKITLNLLKMKDGLQTESEVNIPFSSKNNYTVVVDASKSAISGNYFYKMEAPICFKVQKYEDYFVYSCGKFSSEKQAYPYFDAVLRAGHPKMKTIACNSFHEYILENKPKATSSTKYTIEVFSVKGVIDFDFFKNLENIHEFYKENEKISKYTVGEFTDYAAAQKELKRIIALGYPNAQITKVSDYKEYIYK
ncbi:MAG: hypothetical protein CSA05_00270 [Bacteroidia bacterium]|nr:MAG: hypothetical protein CSB01_01160 [Bacteroidia bacterium]PIE86499.1 MAG: hypothetical protein CSA05_00270 [Bacteroidia bacterium]